MLVAGQRMADKHEVRLVGVERAVGLVGDGKRRELVPAVERQRIVEMRDLALRIGDLCKPNGMVQEGLRYRRFTHHCKSRRPFRSEANTASQFDNSALARSLASKVNLFFALGKGKAL
jgi:hypothetical protein